MTNLNKMRAVNYWQASPLTTTHKSSPQEPSARKRNLIPMEVFGEVIILDPDSGAQYDIPVEMLDFYNKKVLKSNAS